MPVLFGVIDKSGTGSSPILLDRMYKVLRQEKQNFTPTYIPDSNDNSASWCALYPESFQAANVDCSSSEHLCFTHQTIEQNRDHIPILCSVFDDGTPLSFPNKMDSLLTTALFVSTKGNRNIIVRSLDGQIPLYVSRYSGHLIFSTLKRQLWDMGASEVEVISPGEIMINPKSEHDRIGWEPITGVTSEPEVSQTDMISKLNQRLRTSFSKLRGTSRAGILFSGGVDSSLAAWLTREYVDEILLISAFAKSSKDQDITVRHAKLMDMDLLSTEINEHVIWEVLPKVIYAIEKTNPMDIEIAIPFFLSAQLAKSKGYHLIISGQGPDEIFAGYARHVKIFQENGGQTLQKELINDLSLTHEANIARDMKAIQYFGCEAFFPYLAHEFVSYGVSVPPEYKVSLSNEPQRKVIFRKMAAKIGLPRRICDRPKSATQYSSGSNKLLLSSLRQNVEKMGGFTKRESRRALPHILDQIGEIVGIPVKPAKRIASEVELNHVYDYASELGLTAFNQRQDNN